MQTNKKKNKYFKWVTVAVLLGVTLLSWYVAHWEFRKPVLDVHFFHLNRGRSVFIRTPEGKTVLIDGGQSGDVMRELTRVFPFYRRRIDVLIFTSALAKNIGGFGEVARRYEIGRVIGPSVMGTSTALFAFEKALEEKGLSAERMKAGDSFSVGEVNFKVLFPDPGFKFNKTSLPELVLHVEHASTSFLFLGDVSKTIQKSFLPRVGKTAVVEYAHSAADSRVSPELFEKMNPDRLVITKKETARAPSQSKKKFDIDAVPVSRVINLDRGGTKHLTF